MVDFPQPKSVSTVPGSSIEGLWRDLLPLVASWRWSTGGGCCCHGFHLPLWTNPWRRTQVGRYKDLVRKRKKVNETWRKPSVHWTEKTLLVRRYSLRLLNQFFIGVCENPGEAKPAEEVPETCRNQTGHNRPVCLDVRNSQAPSSWAPWGSDQFRMSPSVCGFFERSITGALHTFDEATKNWTFWEPKSGRQRFFPTAQAKATGEAQGILRWSTSEVKSGKGTFFCLSSGCWEESRTQLWWWVNILINLQMTCGIACCSFDERTANFPIL